MAKEKRIKPQGNNLWTRDFTIITLGSVVSMFGNAMSGFALSLYVLDHTASSFLYAMVIIMFTWPQVVMPIFSGAILDRFSRKKTIYTLDFLSAGLYAFAAALLGMGGFHYPVLLIYSCVLGSIESIYRVAYESFYPMLITEGNYSKAYSISSVLETMAAVMIPVSAWLYGKVGIAPLLGINAVCFFIAAVMETRVGKEEGYIETQKATRDLTKSSGSQILTDIREGFRYLMSEKGLLAVAVYYTFISFGGGASEVIALPYFKQSFPRGEYLFMLVWGMSIVGRLIGGLIHYKEKLPAGRKYAVAFCVYILMALGEGTYLFLPLQGMMTFCFLTGIMGITTYTIRTSATQHYVPDEKKGRFNGAFNMMNTTGALIGEFAAGALATVIPPRLVLLGFYGIILIAAIVVIGGRRADVKYLYNTQQ